jgi:hypothetical protein
MYAWHSYIHTAIHHSSSKQQQQQQAAAAARRGVGDNEKTEPHP